MSREGEDCHHKDAETLQAAAKRQGFDKMSDGTWFQRTIAEHIKKRATSHGEDHWERVYPGLDREQRAEKRIGESMRRASLTGAAASAGASTGELLALVTEGLAAPIGVPAALLSMAGEAAVTARLQVDLACDLAAIYGVPFDPNDTEEIATLFGLAFEVDVHKKREEEKTPEESAAESGLTAKLLALEDGEFAKRIGRKLLEESVMRNIIPVVGIAISARWNYVATRRFGATAHKYARYRRVLRHACERLRLKDVADPALIIQGAWLLATVDGDAGHEELLAIGLLLDGSSITADDVRIEETGDDEERWFDRLASSAPDTHAALLDVLYLIAATDRDLEAPERRFLRRVGKAIGREIDLARVQQFCSHLSEGEELPADFHHA